MDSFQHTLDYDTNQYNQSNLDENIEERIVKNLSRLAEEYCVEKKLKKEKDHREDASESIDVSEEDRQRRSFVRIEKIMKQYYMLLESLEFRMERHEQLTKFAQKSMKSTIIQQENRKINMKK